VSRVFATNGEDFAVCEIDLLVGGNYRYVMVTTDGTTCSFGGTYLEVDSPRRVVATWKFDGWPDVDAVESVEFEPIDEFTRVTWNLTFADEAGRQKMVSAEGPLSNFASIERYVREFS